jgi:hypothetical protein
VLQGGRGFSLGLDSTAKARPLAGRWRRGTSAERLAVVTDGCRCRVVRFFPVPGVRADLAPTGERQARQSLQSRCAARGRRCCASTSVDRLGAVTALSRPELRAFVAPVAPSQDGIQLEGNHPRVQRSPGLCPGAPSVQQPAPACLNRPHVSSRCACSCCGATRAVTLLCLPSRSRKLTGLVLQGHHRGEFLSRAWTGRDELVLRESVGAV